VGLGCSSVSACNNEIEGGEHEPLKETNTRQTEKIRGEFSFARIR
jgi:hypothetical protein